jgi:hypothetical protein
MMDLYRLQGSVEPLLQELCRALALGEQLRPVGLPGDIGRIPAPDMLLELFMPTLPLSREVREGAEHLLLHLLERSGNSAVFEEIVRGRRIEVEEHSAEAEYETGWIGLGRVCAFDGPVHIRTPGMVFLPPEEDQAGPIRKILAGKPLSLPSAIRVEILLSGLLGERELPRPLAPADSPREATALLTALTDALEKAGLAEDVSAEEAGPELVGKARASGLDSISYRRYDLDAPLRAWMQALMEHSRPSSVKRRGGRKRKKRPR